MPKKTPRKKAAHKKLCRDKAREGLMNTASGGWTKATGTMGDSMMAGYKIK